MLIFLLLGDIKNMVTPHLPHFPTSPLDRKYYNSQLKPPQKTGLDSQNKALDQLINALPHILSSGMPYRHT
jgi:hypothetical protein